jgi:predicted dehydrogenase
LREEVCGKAGTQGHAELDELLGRADIDLVVLFLPHADCPAAAEKAARAGKQLIVEKPMAATSAGIRRMIEAAEGAGVTLSAPYCWRCHPAAREIKRLVADGVLGEVVALQGRCAAGSVERYRANGIQPWILEREKGGGGPMHNLGVHWIDLFRWLLGDEVQEVTGMVSHMQHQVEVEDNSFALLRFGGGATAALDIGYSVPDAYPAGRDLFIGIRGTRGALSWSPAWGGTADEVFVCSDRQDMADGPVRTIRIGSREVDGYGGISGLVYLRETVAAISAGRAPEITGADGLRALEVVEAVYESAATGRTVAVSGTGG